uniref:Uncharacterized protein n=1 Tax=Ciona savignyi TaxID=51511 RepID=H2YR88_CIOSA
MVDTWLGLRRTSQTSDKPTEKRRRKSLPSDASHSTLTISAMTNCEKRLRNSGTTCISWKKRNMITNRESTGRNMTSTSFASESTNTWANSRNRNGASLVRRSLDIKASELQPPTSSDSLPIARFHL